MCKIEFEIAKDHRDELDQLRCCATRWKYLRDGDTFDVAEKPLFWSVVVQTSTDNVVPFLVAVDDNSGIEHFRVDGVEYTFGVDCFRCLMSKFLGSDDVTE